MMPDTNFADFITLLLTLGERIHTLLHSALIALPWLLRIAVAYSLISLIEYSAHRYLQHTRWLSTQFPRVKLLDKIFHDHAVIHHHKAYDVFNWEPNILWRVFNLVIKYRSTLAVVVVIGGPLYLLDRGIAVLFCLGIIIHNRVWSAVHIEMHVNEGRFIRRTPFFSYWEEYHFVHHLYPGKNYNALFPLWDWILGTYARAGEQEAAALEHTRRKEAVSRREFLSRKYAGNSLKLARSLKAQPNSGN